MTSDPDKDDGTAMISKPHLFFAEVSLDLSRGEFQSGLDKLMLFSDYFPDSYLFHLLCAKAFQGLKKHSLAGDYLRKCCTIAPANQIAWRDRMIQPLLFPQKALPDSSPRRAHTKKP